MGIGEIPEGALSARLETYLDGEALFNDICSSVSEAQFATSIEVAAPAGQAIATYIRTPDGDNCTPDVVTLATPRSLRSVRGVDVVTTPSVSGDQAFVVHTEKAEHLLNDVCVLLGCQPTRVSLPRRVDELMAHE